MPRLKQHQRLGPWTLTKYLGGGGNGEVWLASSKGKVAAVKVLLNDRQGSDGYPRFRREIDTLRKFGHVRGILPLVDAYLPEHPSHADRAWFATEEAELLPLVHERAKDLRGLVSAIADIAEALAHAHAEGLVHRDIKPRNLFVLDGIGCAGDWGLVSTPDKEPLTRHGRAFGTKGFIPDEMLEFPDAVDGRTDVFMLAKSLFAIVSGSDYAPQGHLQPATNPDHSLRTHSDEPGTRSLDTLLEQATRAYDRRITMDVFARELRAWLSSMAEETIEDFEDIAAVRDELRDLAEPEIRRRDTLHRTQNAAIELLLESPFIEAIAKADAEIQSIGTLSSLDLPEFMPAMGTTVPNAFYHARGVIVGVKGWGLRCGVGTENTGNGELRVVAAHMIADSMNTRGSVRQLLWQREVRITPGTPSADAALSQLALDYRKALRPTLQAFLAFLHTV